MRQEQLSLFPEKGNHSKILTIEQLHHEIAGISKYGRKTACLEFPDPAINIPVYVNEFCGYVLNRAPNPMMERRAIPCQ